MNNKQKVLKILDKHRDMSLTMGCKVKIKMIDGNWIECLISTEKTRTVLVRPGMPSVKDFEVDKDFKILGHPATPLTLLKALGSTCDKTETWSMDCYGNFIKEDKLSDLELVTFSIPDVTTLTELPHTHQLWTDLLPILS